MSAGAATIGEPNDFFQRVVPSVRLRQKIWVFVSRHTTKTLSASTAGSDNTASGASNRQTCLPLAASTQTTAPMGGLPLRLKSPLPIPKNTCLPERLGEANAGTPTGSRQISLPVFASRQSNS